MVVDNFSLTARDRHCQSQRRKTLKYYYFNSDAKSLGYSPHAQWIKYNLAFTAGDYEEFGVQALGKLNPWEILFMYVNGCGVVAAGSVSDSWAGSSYRGRDRLVYQNTEYAEYRIPLTGSFRSSTIRLVEMICTRLLVGLPHKRSKLSQIITSGRASLMR